MDSSFGGEDADRDAEAVDVISGDVGDLGIGAAAPVEAAARQQGIPGSRAQHPAGDGPVIPAVGPGPQAGPRPRAHRTPRWLQVGRGRLVVADHCVRGPVARFGDGIPMGFGRREPCLLRHQDLTCGLQGTS